ncbi:tRNA adenosine(34) deaminase TadA [Desulfothermobacter acidiphilus]|uniref:tRNA adenosine(34) deaminase TadA n=1 Tax=Desulfothermobacter acidiphilus TaxID=1938353 RepID=UPI003F8AFB21
MLIEEARHPVFMREALREAERAYARHEVPVGAVAVLEGEIIGRGHNLRETLKDATAHAEILALREAARYLGDWRLERVVLYVTLEPCPMCAGALLQFRVKTLVFGAYDPKAGAAGSVVDLLRDPRFNHQVEVIPGIMAEECAALLRRFFQQLREERRDGRVD